MPYTKQKILLESIRLFSEQSYRSVTMRQIAAAVGIKGSSIYNHFESKQEILTEATKLFISTMSHYLPTPENFWDMLTNDMEPLEILRRFTYSFSPEDTGLLLQLYRILYQEQYRNKELRNFYMQYIENQTKIIASIIEALADLKKIPPASSIDIARTMVYTLESLCIEATLNMDKLPELAQRKQSLFEYIFHIIINGTTLPPSLMQTAAGQNG